MRSINLKNIVSTILILIAIVSCNDEKDIPSIDIIKHDAISWDKKSRCKVIYSQEKDTTIFFGKIKYRGGMSSRYDKHSFALELNQETSLGSLPVDDDWILNANYIDKTFMRHKISYDLFRQMNPQNISPKCSYLNLKINNNPQGLYVLMEKINSSMIGLHEKDSLAMLFKDPPIFAKKEDLQDSINYYHQKYPKLNDDKTNYIKSFIDFMFNSKDIVFEKDIGSWIDLDNVIDWHLLLLFSNNSDGIMKNFYLYKLNGATPFRMAIWDYDHSFGRDGDNELNMMSNELDCNRAILLKRLMNVSETYPRSLKKRWFELRASNVISLENFKKHIAENDAIIKKDILENFNKWPIDAKWYYDANNYKQEVDLMVNFVDLRLQQLDTYFTNLN